MGRTSSKGDAADMARRFHECSHDVDPDQLTEWIHEDAEMSLVMTHFWWLDEFRDGLLWRVRAFVDESEARQAYAQRHDEVLSVN